MPCNFQNNLMSEIDMHLSICTERNSQIHLNVVLHTDIFVYKKCLNDMGSTCLDLIQINLVIIKAISINTTCPDSSFKQKCNGDLNSSSKAQLCFFSLSLCLVLSIFTLHLHSSYLKKLSYQIQSSIQLQIRWYQLIFLVPERSYKVLFS